MASDNIRIITYAPVLIITLCRFNHLKNCIESLSNNTGAEYTDLFIALDYPSKEQHQEGYNKICEYVKTIKGFKNVIVIKRSYNFGSAQNLMAARKEIIAKYDRYIFTDDDNVFSPNFLEFINKGLVKYEKDTSVYAISGYSYYENIPHEKNNFYRQSMGLPVWGFAEWREKSLKYENTFTRKYCILKLLNPYTCIKAWCHSRSTFLFLLLGTVKQMYNDNTMTLYMFFEKKDVILPIVSKVRNMGFDGSGEHCGIAAYMSERKIDDNSFFEYEGTGFEYYKEINAQLLKGKREYISTKKLFKHGFAMMKMVLMRTFFKNNL